MRTLSVRYATFVLAVVDTSTWISCARAGLLPLVPRCGLEVVVLDVVYTEAVTEGVAAGHADATSISAALRAWPQTPGVVGVLPDAAVLHAATETGLLVTNDLALGRRARNAGVRWLRTADLVVLAVRSDRMGAVEGMAAITALRDARRITAALAEEYLEELG